MKKRAQISYYKFKLLFFLEIRSEFLNTIAECFVGDRFVFIERALDSLGSHATAVAFANMRAHEFTRASYFETLGCHLMRLHFGHY